jgi:hypothetical protein
MRPGEWAERDIDSALIAARNAGWSWDKTCLALVRLAADSDAFPRDLVKATQKPAVPLKGAQGDYGAGAAACRAGLERRHDGQPAAGGLRW